MLEAPDAVVKIAKPPMLNAFLGLQITLLETNSMPSRPSRLGEVHSFVGNSAPLSS